MEMLPIALILLAVIYIFIFKPIEPEDESDFDKKKEKPITFKNKRATQERNENPYNEADFEDATNNFKGLTESFTGADELASNRSN